MIKKFTVNSFQQSKQEKRKITMLTSYDYSMAKIVDQAGIDAILVGDSVGMVVQGHDSTIPVTIDEIIYHTKAVKRAVKRAFVVGDMPFLSYHTSAHEAIINAGRLIKEGGAEAVKMEGGASKSSMIKEVVDAQIPVMGHIGLTPQSVNVFGGFKVQGKNIESASQIVKDALALQEAGVFAITLEGIPEDLATYITNILTVPTIGIGAGRHCDGQILVVNDMLGMYSDFVPKFVKKFANLNTEISQAFKSYIDEVQQGTFPTKEHTYSIDEDVMKEIMKDIKA